MATTPIPVSELLRVWRQRRRMSQLDLALDAEVSTRHVSFLETGRAQPSREMLLRLAERMQVPLRDRNLLLTAAGYAPVYPERTLDDPSLRAAREAVDRVLAAHEPYPAIAVDRAWTILSANRPVSLFLDLIDPQLLEPPLNAVRLALHPMGLAPRIGNIRQWRTHILDRLRLSVEATADPALAVLLEEVRAYPIPVGNDEPVLGEVADIAIPLRLRTEHGPLTFITTMTVFGSPVDVTLSELAIEAFLPADPETAETLRKRAAEQPS